MLYAKFADVSAAFSAARNCKLSKSDPKWEPQVLWVAFVMVDGPHSLTTLMEKRSASTQT